MKTTPPVDILKEFTVIIPTVGRPILKECVDAIMKGTVLPACIIVVDQGENPAIGEWLHEAKGSSVDILHIRSAGRSPASARNEGIEQVRSTFVAAIDDDCLAETDWLEVMNERLRENPGTIVTGRVEAAGEGLPQTVITSTVPYLMTHPSIRNLSPLATGNMGVLLTIAHRIGAFDENLFTAEDTDWAYRALRAGIPVLYAPDVVVHHYHWRDSTQISTNYQAYATGLGTFYGKHLHRGDWSMIPRAMLALYRGLKSLLKGWKNRDKDLFLEGSARLTKLIPGMMIGVSGFKSKQKG